jgi:hypothetical protein
MEALRARRWRGCEKPAAASVAKKKKTAARKTKKKAK